ncbi:hypothetical protein JIN84_12435 [Luteolibacter yonseiensis]|uniref:Uncharacterized protein n=1 Tax=Luteolibacter yonseiensis TaxID=1144680 RepID=A0A934VBY8_9BACT|nr:hypothetical protein [Luteolibacter yonseiensis]MBK1816426.1 hypothetical protein [Luteolibacter yonseiensis]
MKHADLNNSNEFSAWLLRVAAFQVDDPQAQFPFTARLAKENGWTLAYAGRVVMEYKRFIALAVAAGHPVTPSEAVDQAWHLHLVYTKSYWNDFCRGVLGRDIHHSPTIGGTEESAKFDDWYRRTLESYRRIFGDEPDPGVWPSPEDRARHAGGGRWIDPQEYWLLRRPTWLRKITRTLFSK